MTHAALTPLLGREFDNFLFASIGDEREWPAVERLRSSALFSTFSLIVACIVKTRDRFMGVGHVLTMPLFFASNAIYPIAIMPASLWRRQRPANRSPVRASSVAR